MVEAGVAIVGGCCGTNPDYIRLLAQLVDGREPSPRALRDACTVASAQNLVALDRDRDDVAVIGRGASTLRARSA